MSDSGFKKVGRPDAGVNAGYIFMQYCGGKGAGGCLLPLGVTGVTIPFKIPRFIVRNRRILFENKEFFGVRIYTDGGSNGLCPNSLGTEVGFYVALSVDGGLTGAQVMARGQHLIGALPYTIEFLAKDIPQPNDPDWDGHIYVQLYWGDASYMNEGGTVPNQESMRIKKHDYDIQL